MHIAHTLIHHTHTHTHIHHTYTNTHTHTHPHTHIDAHTLAHMCLHKRDEEWGKRNLLRLVGTKVI